jgi:integrase
VASAGIRQLPSGRYKVWWRLDDYSQGSQSFDTKDEARDFKHDLLARASRGTWVDPRRGKMLFGEWADEWWQTWASDPDRSPTTLESAEGRLRLHVRPAFGAKQLRAISVTNVRRWQNELRGRLGFESVMACRSLLYRILQAAEDDRRIEANPVRKVPAPKRPVDPEVALGRAKPRVFTPEEFGRLLASSPRFYRDHLVCLAGTGLRVSEFLALRVTRVDLERRRLEVVEARYEAGKFGTGYKHRLKSGTSIRWIPLAAAVAAAIARRVPAEAGPLAIVFTGPGGGNRVKAGTRTALSRGNLRRVYRTAAARADLADLELHGPHDLRHTFATWLEDGGIPARVIDELMGHQAGRRGERDGSAIGARYRHMTAAMEARVVAVLDDRLALALDVAARLLPSWPQSEDA